VLVLDWIDLTCPLNKMSYLERDLSLKGEEISPEKVEANSHQMD